MAKPMQSVDPTLLALQVANTATQNAKKKVLPSLTTQAPMQSSLNAPKQQPQAISTNITPPVAKIGGISSPFGATNINSSPVLGGATPQEIGTRAKELQSLPKAMPETGTSNKIDVNIIGSLGANVMAGEDLPTIRNKYPEFSGIDDEVLGSVLATMYDGAGPEEILQKFPELQGGGQEKGFLEGAINKVGDYIESSDNPLINNKLTRGYMSGLGTVAGITEKAGEGFVQGAKTLGTGMIGLANKFDKAIGILPEDSQNADILANKLGLGKVSDKSLSQDVLNVGEGTFSTAGNVLAPAVSFAFGIGAQTPGLNKALEQVSYGFTKIGEIINKVPGLSNYRDSLPPEDQKRFDSLVGNSLLAFIGSKKGKLKEGDIRGYLDDNFGTIGAYDKAVASNIKESTSGIRKLPAVTSDLYQGTKESYARKVVGLTENTVEAIKSNKYLSEAEGGKLTRDSLTQSAGTLLNKQIQDLSETGRGYSQIRESGIPIDVSSKKPAINKILSDNTIKVNGKGILDFTDSAIESKADQAQLQKVYDYFKRGEVTPDIYLNKKKAIRDMTDFSQGNADQTNRILKQIGSEWKSAGHNSIPELKQLDAIYEPQITDINEIRSKIFDKDGNLREGATSYIMNSLGVNRDVTLQKLEKLMPEISEQVKAIKAVEDINSSKGIRPGTYNKTAAIIGGAKAGAEAGKAVGSYLGSAGEFIGGGIGGIVGAIGGIIATDPAYIINKLRGVDVKLPDEIVQKIKDKQVLSTAQKNKVNDILSSLDKKKQQVIIEQVKKDQKYPIKLKQEGPQTLGATLPKALPKTPPITVEKGAIGMGTPKVNNTPVIPPKATVAPSVSAPKVDTFARMTELDSNPLYKKKSFKETNYGRNAKGLETEFGTIQKVNVDNRYNPQSYTIDGVQYPTSQINNFREKQATEVVAQANKVSKAILDLKAIENGKGNIMGSNLRSVLDDLGIKDVNSIPEGTEQDILQMVRARKPVAPKKGMPKLGKEIMEQNLYHGTNKQFDKFNYSSKDSTYGPGVYFTDSKDLASKYATKRTIEQGGKKSIMSRDVSKDSLFQGNDNLNYKKISDADYDKAVRGLADGSNATAFNKAKAEYAKQLMDEGYDGLQIPSREAKGANEYVVFDNRNIKKTLPPLPKKGK